MLSRDTEVSGQSFDRDALVAAIVELQRRALEL
jgi:hypothetical protein